ncbi:S41 family peptidase [Parapedobacter tibetensis]|uniref:S41 family peptidase n=1 Tax=Parapedobacter tibetensis TaxID=2972951 RepID=UPI00214D9DC8|nr:S41 family peptidase [Parapedobacter tibetensis]
MKATILKLLTILLLLAGAMTGCNRETVMPELERPTRTDTDEDLLKDSVYVYTYLFYLWQDDLPDWFSDIRRYTMGYNSADAVLEALKGYAKDPDGNPYDRFSFLDRTGTINAEIQQGLAGSFGLDVRYDNDTDLYVKKVDLGSPAYTQGIRRGWQILEINGNNNLSLASMEQDNFTFLFNALDAGNISLRLRKPDGEEASLNLSRGNYQIQPILANQVYTIGSKKVGYFAFDSFVSTLSGNNNPTYVKSQLDQLIAYFENEGVQELIVDLRYNGGGAVITAEYLSDMLAPASVGNGLMYTSRINDLLQDDEDWAQLFAPVNFNKTNILDLSRIYFLVTEGTASASELLINNLQPHMDVKLIGEHATYGKPVGFFALDLSSVDLYAVSFQSFNSVGYGDYFSGMPVDKLVFDDLTKDFGDAEESMVAEALYYAKNNNFSPEAVSLQANSSAGNTSRIAPRLNRTLDRHGNKGMYNFGKNLRMPKQMRR